MDMFLAYTDDSGDSGYNRSPTRFFVISCLLIHELEWQNTLEKIIELRRTLKNTYGIPMRAELKAEHLVYGRGPLKGMKRHQRLQMYKELLRFEAIRLDIRVFAVAIAKERVEEQTINDPRERAWQFLMQRLDTFCRKTYPRDKVILLPDEGHGPIVRQIMRRARRFQTISGLYGGQLDIRARYLVEDPMERNSGESYFIQLADWNAYAAHRYGLIDPNTKVSADLWDELGDTRLLEVNEQTGGPPGIVVWPRD